MTTDRLTAYRHARRIIDAMTPAKLHPHEESALREAAEGLLLCSDPEDVEVGMLRTLADFHLESLVDSERWIPETASELATAIEDCGPVAVTA